MKDRILKIILAVCLLTGMSVTSAYASEVSFEDTSGHWAEKAIYSAVEKGLFKGTGENTFSPEMEMKRGMFVTVLGRFAEQKGEKIDGSRTFDDVTLDAYYAPYVAWAADRGIVKGTSETTFSPMNPVTREQMCALFIRLLYYANYDVPSGEDLSFVDSDTISDYAKMAVQKTVALGLIVGMDTDEGRAFCPAGIATRAQVATVFLRLDGLEGEFNIPSQKDRELEAEVSGYLINMLNKYDKTQDRLDSADSIVRNSLELIMGSVQESLEARNQGIFLSKKYVNTTYAENLDKAKELIKSMTDSQKSEMQGIVVGLETINHLKIALNYFGFSGVI